jgi:hypothetical protein
MPDVAGAFHNLFTNLADQRRIVQQQMAFSAVQQAIADRILAAAGVSEILVGLVSLQVPGTRERTTQMETGTRKNSAVDATLDVTCTSCGRESIMIVRNATSTKWTCLTCGEANFLHDQLYWLLRDDVLTREHPDGVDPELKDLMLSHVTMTWPDMDEVRRQPWPGDTPAKPALTVRRRMLYAAALTMLAAATFTGLTFAVIALMVLLA